MRPGTIVRTPTGGTGRVVRTWWKDTWAGHGLRPVRNEWVIVELGNGKRRHHLADELRIVDERGSRV